MSTEERDESQPRPRKVIPSIRRENTDQDSERRPYNQGYNRPEGNNYERRPYNRGGYNSYGDNRSYGDRPSRPRTYDNRDGRITAIMVETVATATLIVKAAITADLLTVAIALMVTTIALLTAMTVLMGTIVRTIVRLARTMKTEERLIRLLRPAKVFRVMV